MNDMRGKRILIIKTGAAGDVLRTTPLLHPFRESSIDWFVASENEDLINKSQVNKVLTSPSQLSNSIEYDFVISLEDDTDLIRELLPKVKYKKVFGAFLDSDDSINYTGDSAPWFDLGLLSRYGLKAADKHKLENRRSYQEIIFDGLGIPFRGERYVLPGNLPTSVLRGDIAVAPKAGFRWPNKNWYGYDQLISLLERKYRVNVLPLRKSMLEHIADIQNHSLVICNDSLPMHIALGLEKACVSLFTCTSPWEIYDYGILTKIVSPLIQDFFYARELNRKVIESISVDTVYKHACDKLDTIFSSKL